MEPGMGGPGVVSKEFAAKKNMESKRSSARFWLILGAVFILFDPVLAHVSNANLIRWSDGLEYVASTILLGGGAIFLTVGVVKVLADKFSK
jgi:hypothetical protein